jgi:hypothetical protein
MFLKGMGAGMAAAAAVGLCFIPRRHKLSRRISRLLKLASGALDGFGAALGF